MTSSLIELDGIDRKRISLYKTLQKQNRCHIKDLQNMDVLPKSIEDFNSIFLYIERKIELRQHGKKPIFDITNIVLYESSVKCLYKVQRSSIFVYCAPGLKTSHHWTLSTVGGNEFSRCRPKVEIIELTNDRDHMYDEADTMRPICIYSRDLLLNHIPYLDVVKTHFCRLTSTTLMEEFLQLVEFCNERHTNMISIGYTGLEADCWVRNAVGVEPGLLTKLYKLSTEMKLWCGQCMILLSYHFIQTIKSQGNIPIMYKLTPSRREHLYKFGIALGLPKSSCNDLLVEAFSLIVNHHVGWHADASNDDRESFNYTHTGSMLVTKSTMTYKAQKIMAPNLFIGDYIFLTAVAYTRNIIGSKSESKEKCNGIKDAAYQTLISELNNTANHFEYRGFVEDRTRLSQYLELNMKIELNQTWNGPHVQRPACSDRMLYYSSFLHQIYLLRSRHTLQRRHWLQIWALTVRECNGQMLHWRIFTKWNSGNYLDGNEFAQSFQLIDHLFFMYDQECIFLQPHKVSEKGYSSQLSTTSHRFQNASEPLCKQKEDICHADMFIISLQINVVHALNSQIEDTNTLARMAYNAACNIDGLGPVKALIAVQLAGAMGIANAVYCLWGLVPIKGKNSGTYKFFNKYYKDS